ncbi:venom serine protease-like [Culicoides brevitarsis]|uniref:venom serine protease-like n=1 Tax=Culicoides brevitarsis TaxID=469753 RepID=UPI00307C113F
MIKFLLFCAFFVIAGALYENNDHVIDLRASQSTYINSPYYPNYTYPPGSSGRYVITAPNGYQIRAECNINIPRGSNGCDQNIFYISPDYNLNLLGAEYLCGMGTVTRTSLFNRMIIAYTSTSTTTAGYFSCLVSVAANPAACDCGWSRSQKLVGGQTTEVNDYVSMAGLVYRPSGSLFCGGTIISYRYIMSAAHCFDTFRQPSEIVARLGDHDLRASTETIYSVDMNIAAILRHPQYNPSTAANDIAILTTASDIIYTRGVGPACLPFLYNANFFDSRTLVAVGWGSETFAGPLSPVLREVSLNVITNANCVSRGYPNLVSSQLCTFSNGRDTCQTDSGGALFYKTTRSFAVAIISFGVACATQTPSVNTRVNSFLTWIQQNTPNAQYCSLYY